MDSIAQDAGPLSGFLLRLALTYGLVWVLVKLVSLVVGWIRRSPIEKAKVRGVSALLVFVLIVAETLFK